MPNIFTAYNFLWVILLPLLKMLSFCDSFFLKLFGLGFIPSDWGLSERLSPKASNGKKSLWLHAASLGEGKGQWALTQSLIETLPSNFQELQIILTTQTYQGLQFLKQKVQENSNQNIHLRLAPFDHPKLVNNFIQRNDIKLLTSFG